MSFNLSDYTNQPKPDKTPGKDFMLLYGYRGETAVFQYWFKGSWVKFWTIEKQIKTRDGKRGELFTLRRGKTGTIYYEAFREFGGELIFLGESETQIVDKSMRTRYARTMGKFN